MKPLSQPIIVLACFMMSCAPAVAGSGEPTVVPEGEKEIARALDADGPAETQGIESVKVLGTVPLANEFPGAEGLVLRAREITMLPGGTVGMHQHQGRAGVAYMLEGEVVEFRQGEDRPLIKRAGDVALENTGTIHGWQNQSDAPARVIVVDIFPAE